MWYGQADSRRVTQPDEFPPRPDSMIRDELMRMNSKIERKETTCLVLLCFVFFFYGLSLGLYGPLYPEQAKTHGFVDYEYGAVMGTHYLATLAFYPAACLIASLISSHVTMALGVVITGVCKILFGTLSLVADDTFFIVLSYAIQIVEGIGFSLLIASSCVIIFSQVTEKTQRNRGIIRSVFVSGISLSPICGEIVRNSFNIGTPFYAIGVVLCLTALILAVYLPEIDQRLLMKDVPFVCWAKSGMLIYFLVVFSTFNYIGFLTVTLQPHLQQFQVSKPFDGFVFSIPVICCGLLAPVWTWLSKKGFNSVMLVCLSSLLILISLLLMGPPTFMEFNPTLGTVCSALFICGVGTAGKLACVVYSAKRDLSSRPSLNAAQEPLLIPTMFWFGALLGCFSGTFIAGFSYFYLGMGEGTYVLLGLEVAIAAIAFVFAFQRNYHSPRDLTEPNEDPAIIES